MKQREVNTSSKKRWGCSLLSLENLFLNRARSLETIDETLLLLTITPDTRQRLLVTRTGR
jgi:hypothetical protein